MESSSTQLSHLRVLDLSRILAAPWAGQILADLGADVVKVERPGSGDDTRSWGPPFLKDAQGVPTGEAAYYLAVNRGKRSLTVNLDHPDGQEIVRRLAAQSDVVLENFKAGTLAKYGLDYASLSAVNPALVYCSVTGFGQTGPRRDQPAYDFLIQAMGGLMSVTGERDGSPGAGPQKVGVPVVDLMTGMYATVAVLAALTRRARTGLGEYIDIAMLDVQVATLANQAMNYLVSGNTPRRTGNAHPNIQPQDVYACLDGDIILVVGNDGQFHRLCGALGQPGWATDERFSTNARRIAHIGTLGAMLREAFGRLQRSDVIARLDAAGVPCGPINSIPQVLDDPQVRHRDMVQSLSHPAGVDMPTVASPMRFAAAPVRHQRPPPLLGEHSDELLRELGYSVDQVTSLRTAGAI
jgi:crotonobetainyl-CoA:carnitine CoA-transferase CaiB-like acyl-CoA transferase